MPETTSLSRRVTAEWLGTAFLLATVVGSGIMGERLAGGNVAVALLGNSLATGAGLVALLLTFGPISGAHFNPLVTLTEAAGHRLPWGDVPAYLLAQGSGAIGGVWLAHLMFGIDGLSWSQHERSGPGMLISEFAATFGLLAVIQGVSRSRPAAVPFAVAGYITAAYWFTASTSFANPAVALARSMTDTFSGIRPADVPAFVAAQVAGAFTAAVLFGWLLRPKKANVLFVCIHNSARSQMAEAFVNRACAERFEAHSAGVEPGRLNPLVVEAMREKAIDLAGHKTQSVQDVLHSGRTFQYVITVCDEASAERCPVFPGKTTRLHWGFPDPSALQGSAEEKLAGTRQIRDAIEQKITNWCAEVCA